MQTTAQEGRVGPRRSTISLRQVGQAGPRMTSKRRKVLFLVFSLGRGGAERVFSILLRQMDRVCFELHLAVLQPDGQYMGDIPDDVVLHNLNVSRVRYAVPAIVRLVRKVRPQVVIATLPAMNMGLIIARPLLPRRTRIMIRQTAIASALVLDEAHPRLWTWLHRHLCKRADRIICPSDAVVKDMVEHFGVPREKIVRIYNPVDVARVQALAGLGDNPFSGSGPQLVAAGRLSREKGFDILLDAMPEVLRHLPNAQLSVLGEGSLLAELKQRAQRLGVAEQVHLLGFQSNPWRFMRHADLFVLPSRQEGMPNAVLEALALGKQVVATDCPGGIREIQGCSDRVVLVPPEDPRALAEAIVAACQTPRLDPEHSQDPAEALSKFSVSQIVGEYSKLLLG